MYRKFQLDGLEISQILDDEKHKALYIRLAKERDADKLRALAREVAEKTDIKNKGAYFMACLSNTKKPRPPLSLRSSNEAKKKYHGKRPVRHER